MGRPKTKRHKADGQSVQNTRVELGFETQEDLGREPGLTLKLVRDVEQCQPCARSTLEAITDAFRRRAPSRSWSWSDLLDRDAVENQSVLIGERVHLPQLLDIFQKWEHKHHRTGETLCIDTMAIDMCEGWLLVHNAVATAQSDKVRFRIAMLAGPPSALRIPRRTGRPAAGVSGPPVRLRTSAATPPRARLGRRTSC